MFAFASGYFSKPTPDHPTIRLGATYQRPRGSGVVEIARVLDFKADSMGIMHVVYEATLVQESGVVADYSDLRRLNITTFKSEFRYA